MARSLLRFLLKSKNQIAIRINDNASSAHGRLLFGENGYSIIFETSDSNLENMDIVCSSNEQGIEQLVVSLSVIKGQRISSGDEQPLYKYTVKYIRYCDSRHILSKEWDPVSVKLFYPQTLHSMFLLSQYSDLKNVNCGKGLTLTAEHVSSVDKFTKFGLYRPCLLLSSNDGSIIEKNVLYQTVTRANAIVTALGYKPIDCQEIQICSLTNGCSIPEEEEHTNHLVLPTIPIYGASDFGPYQDVKLDSIRLRCAFDHFMEKNLAPILYWRACCIFGSKDDLFLENTLNQQFICLDSLICNSQEYLKNKEARHKEVEKLKSYLEEQNPTTEQVGRSMLKFLKSKRFKNAYLGKGNLEERIRKLFYPGKGKKDLSEQEQNFMKVANLIRNDLAHGRMFKWPSNTIQEDEHAAFIEWLYHNIHIAVLNYLNRDDLISDNLSENG